MFHLRRQAAEALREDRVKRFGRIRRLDRRQRENKGSDAALNAGDQSGAWAAHCRSFSDKDVEIVTGSGRETGATRTRLEWGEPLQVPDRPMRRSRRTMDAGEPRADLPIDICVERHAEGKVRDKPPRGDARPSDAGGHALTPRLRPASDLQIYWRTR